MYMFSHLAFYILLVVPPGDWRMTQWRISGGYDSCLVVEHTVKTYNPKIWTRCMSGIEWDKLGRPGVPPQPDQTP